ncbi:zinc finger, CCHC-type containing protein [Tanacetum coccineum]
MNMVKELTLVELSSHLRIEESLRVQDSDKLKSNNVAGPSVVNMMEHNNSIRYNDNKSKRKHQDTKTDPNKKSKVTCWKCEKPGHLKKDCKDGKVSNKANDRGTNGSVNGSSNSLKGHNMFNKYFQVYYVTYVSKTYFMQDDDVAWWVDSGATVHVCKNRCWFKTYKSVNNGSVLHMGNESTALVHGRGYVDLRFSSGKIVSFAMSRYRFISGSNINRPELAFEVCHILPAIPIPQSHKARRRSKVYNWETATYGKIWYDEDVRDLRSVETEFPATVFNDALTSEVALSCEPTVSPLNENQIDFRISFDESDDEEYTVIYDKNSFSYKIISVNDLKTDSENDSDKVNMPSFPSSEPTVGYFDDFDYFKDFEKEFSAIA